MATLLQVPPVASVRALVDSRFGGQCVDVVVGGGDATVSVVVAVAAIVW